MVADSPCVGPRSGFTATCSSIYWDSETICATCETVTDGIKGNQCIGTSKSYNRLYSSLLVSLRADSGADTFVSNTNGVLTC